MCSQTAAVPYANTRENKISKRSPEIEDQGIFDFDFDLEFTILTAFSYNRLNFFCHTIK